MGAGAQLGYSSAGVPVAKVGHKGCEWRRRGTFSLNRCALFYSLLMTLFLKINLSFYYVLQVLFLYIKMPCLILFYGTFFSNKSALFYHLLEGLLSFEGFCYL